MPHQVGGASQVAVVTDLSASLGDAGDTGSIPGWGGSPGGGNGNPLQCSLPGESCGQRSLMDFSPWGLKESDTTERHSAHVFA